MWKHFWINSVLVLSYLIMCLYYGTSYNKATHFLTPMLRSKVIYIEYQIQKKLKWKNESPHVSIHVIQSLWQYDYTVYGSQYDREMPRLH